jgi:PPOX class probable F420-dependent enzyme
MERDAVVQFLSHHHRAVLATTRADGSLQLSPVVACPNRDGQVVISTRERSVKVQNLRRDRRGALCVFTDGFFGPWIEVEGDVHIVSLPDAMDGLVQYYRAVSGEHPDWEEYREAMRAEGRVLLVLDVVRAGPDHPR